ncbi:MAG: AAA family ATPase [Chromatiales bacterium]|nr:AAA family ATPase [Chromatiales bacterium]
MIERLYMKNFAIADELTIQFTQGFNVITGETGAGKSIILNAIAMIMGDRAENTLIRTGEEEALIEAVFSNYDDSLQAVLNDKGLTSDEIIIIKRIIKRNGKNSVFINGSQTTLSVLRELMELLIDLNNQNDHQRLMPYRGAFSFS